MERQRTRFKAHIPFQEGQMIYKGSTPPQGASDHFERCLMTIPINDAKQPSKLSNHFRWFQKPFEGNK